MSAAITQSTPTVQASAAVQPAQALDLEAVLAETRQVMDAAKLALSSRPTAWTPRTWAELEAFAKRAARSGMVPKSYEDKEDAIIVAIQMGAELGLAPMQALQNIAVINGRPSVWGDAIPGLCYASGKCVYIREWLENEGDEMVAYCSTLRRGEQQPAVQSFSVADAKRAGLWQTEARVKRFRRDGGGSFEVDNDSPWYKYPKRMLQSRARIVLRDKFPDVLKGLISAEEAMDLPPDRPPEPERHPPPQQRHVGGPPRAASRPKPPPPPPPMPAPQPAGPPPMPSAGQPRETEAQLGDGLPDDLAGRAPEPPSQNGAANIQQRVARAIKVISEVDTLGRLAHARKKADGLFAEAPDPLVEQLNAALFEAERRIAAATAAATLPGLGAPEWPDQHPEGDQPNV